MALGILAPVLRQCLEATRYGFGYTSSSVEAMFRVYHTYIHILVRYQVRWLAVGCSC